MWVLKRPYLETRAAGDQVHLTHVACPQEVPQTAEGAWHCRPGHFDGHPCFPWFSSFPRTARSVTSGKMTMHEFTEISCRASINIHFLWTCIYTAYSFWIMHFNAFFSPANISGGVQVESSWLWICLFHPPSRSFYVFLLFFFGGGGLYFFIMDDEFFLFYNAAWFF